MEKIRVVLDSNVFISAVLFGGKPEEILDLSRSSVIEIFISQLIVEEISTVFEKKFKWNREQLKELMLEIDEITQLIEIKEKIRKITKDPDDNIILECAKTAKVDAIVSGDSHLLELKRFAKIKIISPTEFMALINKLN